MLPGEREYQRLFEFLRLPALAGKIAFEGVLPPLPGVEAPWDAYGFLPALLPLWIGQGVKYTGGWRHWFGSRRMTFVEVTVGNNSRANEAARDFDQLMCRVVQDAADSANALTPSIAAFGTQAGLSLAIMEQIGQISQEWGGEREGMLSLPRFASSAPLECFSPAWQPVVGYTGDFPHDTMPLNEETLRNMCTAETSRELQTRIAALPFAPPWFTAAEQAPVFRQLLRRRDYLGAWMSLNSSGWRWLEARDALRDLAEVSNVPGLDLLADAWAAVPHERNGWSPELAGY